MSDGETKEAVYERNLAVRISIYADTMREHFSGVRKNGGNYSPEDVANSRKLLLSDTEGVKRLNSSYEDLVGESHPDFEEFKTLATLTYKLLSEREFLEGESGGET